MKGWLRPLNNEKGSMSILSLFTVIGVVAGSVWMLYFFMGFIEKRQSQNIADAAALAASQELRDRYEDAMKDKVVRVSDAFKKDILELVEDLLKKAAEPSPSPSGEPGPSPAEPTPEPTPAPSPSPTLNPGQLKKDRKELFLKLATEAGVGRALAEKLYDGLDKDKDWLMVVTDEYFKNLDVDGFTADLNGSLLCDTYRQNSGMIKNAVSTIVQMNGGSLEEASITFPNEQEPKMFVKAGREMNITNISFKKNITSLAAGGLGSKKFDIDVSKCPQGKDTEISFP
ncbi:hypothetical protein N6H14_33635 [Paenibacillus sp. CC-CFT747]|nr:hypothetical protein N6H14_33635 [Paenibacillus sp. CC-CFT747]